MAPNGNGENGTVATLKLWQVLVGQLPWFITVLALGGWYAAKMDARLVALEHSTARIEARQEADQADQIRGMKEQLQRMKAQP